MASNKLMRIKIIPANFFLNSIFFFLLLLIPFSATRLYFYFNYFFSAYEAKASDLFGLILTGFRFDLCVIGFLLIPSYVLYLASYWEKISLPCQLVNQLYKVIVVVAIFFIFHFNIPFLATNVPFDIPYWMRWEDYRSVFFLDCKVCYWDYNYLERIHPAQIISGLMYLLIIFGIFSRWTYFTKKYNFRRDLLFFIAIILMARGKIGQHHLRYEDSLWHNNSLVNELSNNPLWLMNKSKY